MMWVRDRRDCADLRHWLTDAGSLTQSTARAPPLAVKAQGPPNVAGPAYGPLLETPERGAERWTLHVSFFLHAVHSCSRQCGAVAGGWAVSAHCHHGFA